MSCTLDIAHSLLFCAGHQIPCDKTNNTDHAEDESRRALISGFTPMRTLEKTSIGKVVAPGPETKLAITGHPATA